MHWPSGFNASQLACATAKAPASRPLGVHSFVQKPPAGPPPMGWMVSDDLRHVSPPSQSASLLQCAPMGRIVTAASPASAPPDELPPAPGAASERAPAFPGLPPE